MTHLLHEYKLALWFSTTFIIVSQMVKRYILFLWSQTKCIKKRSISENDQNRTNLSFVPARPTNSPLSFCNLRLNNLLLQSSKIAQRASMAFFELSRYLSERDFRPSMEITSGHDTHLWKGQELPWNGLSCLSVVDYVLKFCSDADHADVLDIIRRLDNLAWRIHRTALLEEPAIAETSFVETFVNSFMPKVQDFFAVPRRNENLAGFLCFLLQILNSETDQTQHERSGVLHHGLGSLQKELTFLLAVLGDVPFQFTEVEQDNKYLLIEFEAVSSEAGHVIYSYVFSTFPVNIGEFCVCSRDLSARVFKLYEKIKSHCIKLSKLPPHVDANPRHIGAADSLFIVKSLLEIIETCNPDLIGGVKDQIKSLYDELLLARSFLQDVNVPPETDIQGLKECIVQVRDTAYEAEYLVNSFVLGNFPLWYFTVRLPTVIQKFKHIGKGFREVSISHGTDVLKLQEDTAEALSQPVVLTPMTLDIDIVVGLEDKKIEILDELTGGSENLRLVSISGMPGIGKTTLAKKLYNDCLISNRFDQCAWCVVSQTYWNRRVLIDILLSLISRPDKANYLKMDDESLIEELYHCLKGRRYLIVMDDVWDSNVWDKLGRYFPNDRNGSRVMFTTRNQNICPINSAIHTLTLMSEDQCWELLQKKVFHSEPCPPQLLEVGKRIAVNCNGLPLAVVVIAGVLTNMEKERSAWEKVGQSFNAYTHNYMKIFELSYAHLPNHLKLCFLYFGLMPEDSKVPVKKLIWLWISEGFIPKDEGKSQEHVAREYLKNLIDRSLVLVATNRSTGGVKACSIHDLLRDMCLIKAQEENFSTLVTGDHILTYETHHRLCILSEGPAHSRSFSLHCRAFFGHLSDPSSCLPQMKHLRVMELLVHKSVRTFYRLKKLEKLVYLRYLVVDRMPEPSGLGSLVNLEVLVVNSNLDIVYVPPILLQMDKLKHLHINRQAKFEDDCISCQPNNLQSLSFLSIYSTNACAILASSPHLRKLKCLCPPEIPDFHFLTELASLKVVTRDMLRIPINNAAINIPSTIRKLSISGTRLPWEKMSVLGRLPKLQVLKLSCKAFEGKEWKTCDLEFQELKFLKLDAIELEQWIVSSEHFPRIQHLVLQKCKDLLKIPAEFGDIPTLLMIEVQHCSYGASTSASHIEQAQRDNGNEELKVIITNRRDLMKV